MRIGDVKEIIFVLVICGRFPIFNKLFVSPKHFFHGIPAKMMSQLGEEEEVGPHRRWKSVLIFKVIDDVVPLRFDFGIDPRRDTKN